MALAITVKTNAPAYARMIQSYATETGKSIEQALLREGPDFANALYRAFKAISPSPDSISDAAKARGFRMGRRSNDFVQASAGLSEKAQAAAQRVLGGDKSDLFRVVAGSLVPVRFSGRAGHRLLRGGRFGRRFAKGALRASELPPEALEASLNQPFATGDGTVGDDVKRLNLRAVATYYELIFRRRAAAEGFLAYQWLYKRWRAGSQTKGRPAELETKDADGKLTGKVDFQTGAGGDVTAIVLTGYVPGTAEQLQKHGILESVAGSRIEALRNAIILHHQKAARAAGLDWI
jgi:hypothetical protein